MHAPGGLERHPHPLRDAPHALVRPEDGFRLCCQRRASATVISEGGGKPATDRQWVASHAQTSIYTAHASHSKSTPFPFRLPHPFPIPLIFFPTHRMSRMKSRAPNVRGSTSYQSVRACGFWGARVVRVVSTCISFVCVCVRSAKFVGEWGEWVVRVVSTCISIVW